MASKQSKQPGVGTLALGVIAIIAGVYFRGYAPQSFSCNAATAFGVPAPKSCVWYQGAYQFRNWIIIFGIVSVVVAVIALTVDIAEYWSRAKSASPLALPQPPKATEPPIRRCSAGHQVFGDNQYCDECGERVLRIS